MNKHLFRLVFSRQQFGGAVLSENYAAVGLGSAVSTFLGGFSADYIYANSSPKARESSNGDSVRFIYSTLIAPTKTNITLSSYRYSSREYWSFNEFLANENSHSNTRYSSTADNEWRYFGAKQKGRFDINLRQRLAPGYGNFSITGSTRNYWNRKGSDTQYQFSYSNHFNDLTYDLSANRVKNQNNRQYNEFRLSLTLPIFASNSTRQNYLSSNTWYNSEAGGQTQAQLGGIAGDDQEYTYGITTTQGLDSKNPQQSYGVNGSYRGSKAFVTAGASTGKGYHQASVGISGSLLAHAGGLTLGQTLGETVALIEAKDAHGARITSSNGAVVDGSGFGVVPYLSPYTRNRVEIDPEGLSSDLIVNETSIEAVPVAGSIVKVKFETSKENIVFINGKLEDGAPLPFGAEVVDSANGKMVGYVGQAGTVLARGIQPEGRLIVKLKGRSCGMDYSTPAHVESGAPVNSSTSTLNAVCRF